jgi:hypothetical protein
MERSRPGGPAGAAGAVGATAEGADRALSAAGVRLDAVAEGAGRADDADSAASSVTTDAPGEGAGSVSGGRDTAAGVQAGVEKRPSATATPLASPASAISAALAHIRRAEGRDGFSREATSRLRGACVSVPSVRE